MKNNLDIDNESEFGFEINFLEIFKILKRRKSIVAIFGLASLIISVSVALTTKRVWEGNFQIVIESKNKLSGNLGSSLLSQLTFLNSTSNEIQTEVEILRSPLLLNEIYEYVLKEKKISQTDLLYEHWRDDIDVELSRKASVLKISYRDTDKDLILATLKKISDSYQNYSGQTRLRNISLGLNYFKDQIQIYKNKSSESIAKVQEFATKNDFNFLVNYPQNDENKRDLYKEINVEVNRLKASNKLREIETKIKQINELGDDNEFLKYLSKSILNDDLKKILDDLLKVEVNLAYAEKIYKRNDKYFQALEKNKFILISKLRRETINTLNAAKYAEEINLEKYQRTKESLIKYRQLINEAEKDLRTFDNLNKNYRLLELERARIEDPWRLISDPKLLEIPVYPRRKKIVLISLLSGLIVGSAVAIYDEKKRKVIYSLDAMKNISKWKFLSNFSYGLKNEWIEAFQLLQIGFFSNLKGNVGIVLVGEIDKEKINSIKENLSQSSSQLSFVLEKDIIKLSEYENIIAITELGVTKIDEINTIKSKLEIMKKNIIAFISISK